METKKGIRVGMVFRRVADGTIWTVKEDLSFGRVGVTSRTATSLRSEAIPKKLLRDEYVIRPKMRNEKRIEIAKEINAVMNMLACVPGTDAAIEELCRLRDLIAKNLISRY